MFTNSAPLHTGLMSLLLAKDFTVQGFTFGASTAVYVAPGGTW